MRLLWLILLLAGLTTSAHAKAADWITSPASSAAPVVLHFRKALTFDKTPAHLWVDVSADNRFLLYVNGRRAASGPATSDLAHWRYARIDIAPFLKPGQNTLSATVWDFVIPNQDDLSKQTGPLSQQSAGAGFYLKTEDDAFAGLNSGPDWQVALDKRRYADPSMARINTPNWVGYYVAGAPETIDARQAVSGWESVVVSQPRALTSDPLPQMTYALTDNGHLVRGEGHFPDAPQIIPAHSHVTLLIRRENMLAAYPQLRVSGGKDAVIKATYAEALYDKAGRKGIRDEVGDRVIRGLTDTFIAGGEPTTFESLHWRVWRFLQLDIETQNQPLTLEGFKTFETGYPFETVGRFKSSDPVLNDIWTIGWRTARLDAHETYMDSAYWEQLQYVGDTRIQMLISYAVSGDKRLADNAIDAFGWSNTEGGLTEGAYPSRGHNPIAPFSLLWLGMMHDYWMNQPDTTIISRNLPRAREVLAWFRPYLHADGLLGKNPTWNFVDWVGKDRDAFPSFDDNEESCLTSLIYLGALQQAADLEHALGNVRLGDEDAALAETIKAGLQARCWDAQRQLYADDPSKTLFSQHTNALAVLYDVAPADQQIDILTRITGRGIEPAGDLIPVSYYFSWYLVRAYEHAGLSDRYLDLLQTWRDLLPLRFSTWPEAKLEDRSDSHAWSAHPTADLLAIVAGVQSAAPGYAGVRIAPHLGDLKDLSATVETPYGPVRVNYIQTKSGLTTEIDMPSGLPGEFVWKGKTWSLKAGKNRLKL
ncbi:alpha-L-rhamnosidase C-terminal domain-containing protein [Asticcacaulis sp.]|uniref:alpha-L-rhamnosidase-related protein n=1 Tax=Asticcacaulis sp. TaxID=1872648 RepID=UPI002CC313D3|nr:alpha-L-rhamnosidase C-terminal domain-containing protein [Asticcacaulis sp.]HTM80125.1 alpha-L-rhamnosidase C-terminal domain-containing protein [Asticcacaulis sp.]